MLVHDIDAFVRLRWRLDGSIRAGEKAEEKERREERETIRGRRAGRRGRRKEKQYQVKEEGKEEVTTLPETSSRTTSRHLLALLSHGRLGRVASPAEVVLVGPELPLLLGDLHAKSHA